MTEGTAPGGIPATERVIVGLCHGLNDRIAAVSAYLFMVERRGELQDLGAAFHAQVDRLAHSVRLMRSLAREPAGTPAPVAVSLLAESATELMEAYPEGPVVYRPREGDEGSVVRCDWARALRALVIAGAWVGRGLGTTVEARLAVEHESNSTVLVLSPVHEVSQAHDAPLREEEGSEGIKITPVGPRSAEIRFPRRF